MYNFSKNGTKDKYINNSFGTTTINTMYKEMYYPPLPKLEETEYEILKKELIWTHMMNISMQNTVIQMQKSKIAC